MLRTLPMEPGLTELMLSAIAALPQCVLIVEPGGLIVGRNAAATTMLGAGEDVASILSSGEPGQVVWEEELSRLAESAGRTERRGVRLCGRGGRKFAADVYLRLLGSGAGCGEDMVLVVADDVSRRVSTERRLAATRELAGAGGLSAEMAHELSNPLDGAMRYLGLAGRVAGDEAREYLDRAREALTRVVEIIRAAQPAGRARLQDKPLERLLEDAVNVMAPRAESLGVAIVSDLDGSASRRAAAGLFQVFCNVIKNSLDAMPGGGLLKVTLRGADGQVIVRFADTGCGIATGDAERIFEAFHTTKPPGQGAGLGLAISREIVARAGGSISAAARSEGGAVVTIKLPAGGAGTEPTEDDA